MKKITLAFDSFKGSLSSQEVADAFQVGFCSLYPHCEVQKVYIADGGEGTVVALTETLNGRYIDVVVTDPLGRPVTAQYGLIDDGATAILEMASASGLPLLKECERNPLLTSTYGTGEMIADAINRGCRKILMGIGGSATNDGGMGMLQALGYRFYDCDKKELNACGGALEQIVTIDDSQVDLRLKEVEFIVACDVINPLYGENGAAYIFAPQKGADDVMVEQLDKGLRNLAEVIKKYNGQDIAMMQGAGAAGGLGGGLAAFLQARLERGVEMILDAMQFDQLIAGSDYIFTGEGRIDAQTLMGKAPYGVLQRAMKQDIPTIAIAGSLVWSSELEQSAFNAILPIIDRPLELQEALRTDVARENIRRTALQIASIIALCR